MFRGIEVDEKFKGSTSDARDRDMTGQVLEFAKREHSAGTPFFAFAFYKSTHTTTTIPKRRHASPPPTS